MNGYLEAALLAAAIVATGRSTLGLIGVQEPSALLRWGFSIAAGFVVTMLALYLPLALLDRVEFLPALIVLALGSAIAVFRFASRLPSLASGFPGLPVTLILIAVGVPVVAANLVPYRGYDAKAIFGLKAKVLLYERGVHGPLFQDVDLVHYHADYPLGVPLLGALAGWTAEGEPVDPQGIQPAQSAEEWVERHDAVHAYMVLALLWIVGIVAVVAGLVRARVQRPELCVALVALVLPVVLIFPGVSYADSRSVADADRPLVLCLGVTGLAIARWLESPRRSWLILAGLCTAGAMLLKNEALLAAGTLVVAVVAVGRGRRSLSAAAVLLAGLGLGLSIVQAVRARLPGAPYDEQYLAALSLDRIPAWIERIPHLLDSLDTKLSIGTTLTLWVTFVVLAAPIAWRAGGGARALMIWVVINQLICACVLLVTPNHFGWHANVALNRLWFAVAIPAAALVVEAVTTLWSQGPTGQVEPSADGSD